MLRIFKENSHFSNHLEYITACLLCIFVFDCPCVHAGLCVCVTLLAAVCRLSWVLLMGREVLLLLSLCLCLHSRQFRTATQHTERRRTDWLKHNYELRFTSFIIPLKGDACTCLMLLLCREYKWCHYRQVYTQLLSEECKHRISVVFLNKVTRQPCLQRLWVYINLILIDSFYRKEGLPTLDWPY